MYFSVPPDKPRIYNERGQVMMLKLGPHKIGDIVLLKCVASGGIKYYLHCSNFTKYGSQLKKLKGEDTDA